MIRPMRLLGLGLIVGLAGCAEPPKPTQSFIDVADAAPATLGAQALRPVVYAPVSQAAGTEPGRILSSSLRTDTVAYVVQRLRDDTVIQVSQPDRQALPTGLKVAIRYGDPVRIEAAPTTPDIGPPTPPVG